MEKLLIKDAHIVNEGKTQHGDVYIENGIIKEIASSISIKAADSEAISALCVSPGSLKCT